MTLVAIWLNPSHPQFPGVWCAADGRVRAGSGTLTDRYVKVLPLRVRCLKEGGSPYATRTIGVAFAGNTLVSSLWYGFAQEVCWDIEPVADVLADRKFQPNLMQLARLLSPFLKEAIVDVAMLMQSAATGVVALFGIDENEPAVVAMTPTTKGDLSVEISRHVLTEPFRFGSGEDLFDRHLDSLDDDDALAPARAVLKTARGENETAVGDVGGIVSVGVVGDEGFLRLIAIRRSGDEPSDYLPPLGTGAIQFRPRIIWLDAGE